MIVGVEIFIDGGAFQPEIGAQINHLATQLQERRGVFGGDAMRQREENNLRGLGQRIGFGFGEAQGFGQGMIGEFGENLGDGLPGVLARGDDGEFDLRMMQEDSDQFFPGIAGGADDGNFRFHLLD